MPLSLSSTPASALGNNLGSASTTTLLPPSELSASASQALALKSIDDRQDAEAHGRRSVCPRQSRVTSFALILMGSAIGALTPSAPRDAVRRLGAHHETLFAVQPIERLCVQRVSLRALSITAKRRYPNPAAPRPAPQPRLSAASSGRLAPVAQSRTIQPRPARTPAADSARDTPSPSSLLLADAAGFRRFFRAGP